MPATITKVVHRQHGLPKVTVKNLKRRAPRVLHVITVVCLGLMAAVVPLGPIYLAVVAGGAALLAYEQSLVSADDLSRVKFAFDLNGWVGMLYMVTTGVALYVR